MLLVFVQAYLIKKAGLIGVDELASMEILLVIFGLSSYTLDAFAHSAEFTAGFAAGFTQSRIDVSIHSRNMAGCTAKFTAGIS